MHLNFVLRDWIRPPLEAKCITREKHLVSRLNTIKAPYPCYTLLHCKKVIEIGWNIIVMSKRIFIKKVSKSLFRSNIIFMWTNYSKFLHNEHSAVTDKYFSLNCHLLNRSARLERTNLTWCQFHQHFTCVVFVRKHVFGAKILYESSSLSKISYKKRARKMLMKLNAAVG